MADAIKTAAEITLAEGRFVITAEDALTLPVDSYARNGVILKNERRKVNVIDPTTGKAVEFTASIYLQRSAVTEDEAAAVAKLSSERDAKAAQKKAEEEAKLSKIAESNLKLGQDTMLSAMRNISQLSQAASLLGKL